MGETIMYLLRWIRNALVRELGELWKGTSIGGLLIYVPGAEENKTR